MYHNVARNKVIPSLKVVNSAPKFLHKLQILYRLQILREL